MRCRKVEENSLDMLREASVVFIVLIRDGKYSVTVMEGGEETTECASKIPYLLITGPDTPERLHPSFEVRSLSVPCSGVVPFQKFPGSVAFLAVIS